MAITKFRPTVWAAQLLSVLSKSLVYAGPNAVNRNYEGDISAYGDTVKIVSVADPTIKDYTKDTDLTVEVLTDAEQTLTIDQAKAFAFEIDDIDMRQVRSGGALMSEAARRAGFGLADTADKYVANLMWQAAGKDLGTIDASTTVANVYDKLILGARTALTQASVPNEGRWLAVDPAVVGQLLQDSRFVKVNESGSADGLRNGLVGRAGGFNIFETNNAPTTNRSITSTIAVATTAKTLTSTTAVFYQSDVGSTVAGTNIAANTTIVSVSSDGKVATMSAQGSAAASQTDTVLSGGNRLAIAGSTIATSYAEQISKVEAFRPEKRFADALKGLHLYGAKVVRPEALVFSGVKV